MIAFTLILLSALSRPLASLLQVLRRFDYTEESNPDHLVVLMSASRHGGGPLAPPIATAQLDPTAAELLKYVETTVLAQGYRPAELAVDTQSAVAGVRGALRPTGL